MAFRLSIESYFSVHDVSVDSWQSSSASLFNDLNPGGNLGKCGGRLWYFAIPKVILFWFVIGHFLGGDVASYKVFLFFLGMCVSGVTLSPVVTVEKTETSVRILGFTIIYFGAGGSDWLIKFGALVTFCVLIDSLGNIHFSKIGATIFSFAFFSYHLMTLNP